ncbi:type II toxin-antitoxin system PemK/MazF family toxin [Arthrobacter sp. R1-13]
MVFSMALNFRSIAAIVRSSLRLLNDRGRVAASGKPSEIRGRSNPASGLSSPYRGDFTGTADLRYSPSPDGKPDPGEVIWTWVPFEEDHSQGKDRPVLLVGSHGGYLLGVMLTTKDHGKDYRRSGDYVDLGPGSWDRQWRPSEARLDRILQINPKDIRREGAIIDAGSFVLVADALKARHGWN